MEDLHKRVKTTRERLRNKFTTLQETLEELISSEIVNDLFWKFFTWSIRCILISSWIWPNDRGTWPHLFEIRSTNGCDVLTSHQSTLFMSRQSAESFVKFFISIWMAILLKIFLASV